MGARTRKRAGGARTGGARFMGVPPVVEGLPCRFQRGICGWKGVDLQPIPTLRPFVGRSGTCSFETSYGFSIAHPTRLTSREKVTSRAPFPGFTEAQGR